jgi:hypothetical protein
VALDEPVEVHAANSSVTAVTTAAPSDARERLREGDVASARPRREWRVIGRSSHIGGVVVGRAGGRWSMS